MQTEHHLVDNGAGWELSLHRTWEPEKLVPGRRPVLIVPGYGMNSFIFSYHPGGVSMEGRLAEAGFEVWRCDLRHQGGSVARGGDDDFSLADLALVDLGVAIDAVLARTRTGADRVSAIGASLGGTLVFIQTACNPAHRVGAIVALGSPLRWVAVHPAIRLVFASPLLIGLVRFRGTRRLSELGLPLLARWSPWLLSIYVNADITDVSAAREMVRTVEDPNRHINREMALWIRERDLVIRGVNVAEAFARLDLPLFCLTAAHDGIVPEATAAFPYHCSRAKEKQLRVVGTREMNMAHADLFVSNQAHKLVFDPMAEWLARV
jgi:pimeloyl-ACP methyl ester carboxylesterase